MQANSQKVTGAPTASMRERKVTLTKKLEDQLENELMLAPGARTRYAAPRLARSGQRWQAQPCGWWQMSVTVMQVLPQGLPTMQIRQVVQSWGQQARSETS